jgi:hypothetical protein
MKIVQAMLDKYECARQFDNIKVGEIFERDHSTGLDLVATGRAIPCGIPKVAEYRACITFKFELSEKLIEIKSGETLKVKKLDALKLMLARKIIPVDLDNVWHPYELRKLRQTYVDSFRIGNKEVKVVSPVPEKPEQPKPFITGWKK